VQDRSVPWQPGVDADGSAAVADARHRPSDLSWRPFSGRLGSAAAGTPQPGPSCCPRHPPPSRTLPPTSDIFPVVVKASTRIFSSVAFCRHCLRPMLDLHCRDLLLTTHHRKPALHRCGLSHKTVVVVHPTFSVLVCSCSIWWCLWAELH